MISKATVWADAEVMRLRRSDYSLSEEHESLTNGFRAFFEKHSGPEVVRGSEPVGYDVDLWRMFGELRPVLMAVPTAFGGDGAGVVELALIAQEIGRFAAPVPLIEAAVAARLLAAVGQLNATGHAREALEEIAEGGVASICVAQGTDRSLVPSGAAATQVLGLVGVDLVLVRAPEPPTPVGNLAAAPLAWWDLTHGTVLASGSDAAALYGAALNEWRILTAAALVGLGQASLELGVAYARDRHAFGTSIGAFQAIAHPLADAFIALDGAERLTRRTAWFLDNDPEALGALAIMAFLQAAAASERSGATALHTQGGFGFTLESDVQLFYRRAKGWALVGGERGRLLREIADVLYGPTRTARGDE